MRPYPIPPSFHAANRRRLAETIGEEAIAVIDTADIMTRPGDFEYPFRPDSNFYYLTGIAEPGAVLVLAPGQASAAGRELLFVSGTDEFVGTWQGERLTPEAAAKTSGVTSVLPLADLPRYLDRLLAKYQTIYLNADESLDPTALNTPARRRAAAWRRDLPLHTLRSALPQLARQRLVKDPAEVALMREAIAVTGAGLAAAMAAIRPGRYEYEVEAELTAEFTRRGAGQAFTPIIAAGRHTTVMHHGQGAAKLGPEDMVLMDVGAEVGYYAADISRTVPAGGRFTSRQRAVYELVSHVQQAAIPLHKPGATVLSIDDAMRAELTAGLADLGLITKAQAASKTAEQHLRKYYPTISHHLGLDVHDSPDFRTPFEPGMVVTCEPGLYLREEEIGVRLEDDILITESGCEVLSADIPSGLS